MSLEDIENETKIRKFYISALEEDSYHLLPAMVYASGFVRRYARLLGLDENEFVQEFKSIAYQNENKEEEVFVSENMRERLKVPIKNIIAGLVFLVVVIWMGSYLIDFIAAQNWGRNQVAPPPIANNGEIPEKEPGQTPAINGVNLRISGQKLCWIRATVDGNLIPDTMLKAGEVKEIKANESIQLHLGNAGGVKIEFNGKDLGVPGKSGQTMKLEYPPPS